MKKSSIAQGGVTVAALSILLLLPGCGILDLIQSKIDASASRSQSSAGVSNPNDTSKVLLSIDGKPAITEKTFNDYYDQFIAANPRLQNMIQFMPNAKKEIFNGMVNERILLAWGEKNGIHQSPDYQKELEQGVRMIKTGLAAKQFEKDLVGKVSVTDKEMRDYYDKHKDPELITSPGGVKTLGVEFGSKEKAQAFFDTVKGSGATFKKDAGSQTVKEFAPVNAQSFDIDEQVKAKVLAATGLPKVMMVEASDKKYWVVAAQSKTETQYRSFDEVKDGISKMIERERMMKIYNDKVADLKKQYNVVEDEAFFAQQVPQGMPMIPGGPADQGAPTAGESKAL